MSKELKLDIPPTAAAPMQRVETMRTLATALGLSAADVRQVGNNLFYLDSSGTIRAAFMVDVPAIVLYDWPGASPSNWIA